MKQFKWVFILAAAAAVLLVIFLFVDSRAQKQKEREAIGGPQQLISFDSTTTERITLDNDEGHYEFGWNAAQGRWEVISEDKFNVNSYAIAAICNYICDLSSEKTVSFNCENPDVYGFDHAVTLKVYTTETGEEHPYTLYVGDHTPTNTAFYVMVADSRDVFTIDYEKGSIFCAAKNTLKDMYLFNTFGSLVTYFRHDKDGKTVMELTRGSDSLWTINNPGSYNIQKAAVDNMMEIVVRATVTGYVDEHPADPSVYGLDHPTDVLVLKGSYNNVAMDTEIWFGKPISDREDEIEIYGWFKDSEQVFRIYKADTAFLSAPLSDYVYPYCIEVAANELKEVTVDLGEVADVRTTLSIDYVNAKYAIDGTDVTALENDKLNTLYQNLYRSVIMLPFTDTAPEASPDLSAEPAMTMQFTYTDGHTRLLTFIEFEANNFYVIDDGKYTGLTIRTNRLEGTGSIPFNYTELMRELEAAKK